MYSSFFFGCCFSHSICCWPNRETALPINSSQQVQTWQIHSGHTPLQRHLRSICGNKISNLICASLFMQQLDGGETLTWIPGFPDLWVPWIPFCFPATPSDKPKQLCIQLNLVAQPPWGKWDGGKASPRKTPTTPATIGKNWEIFKEKFLWVASCTFVRQVAGKIIHLFIHSTQATKMGFPIFTAFGLLRSIKAKSIRNCLFS